MDDVADRQSYRETRTALELDDLSAGGFCLFEALLLHLGIETGPLVQRQAGHGGARPDRHHAVSVFAQNERLDLRGGNLQSAGQIAAKTGRVELSAQANDALPRQACT